MKKYTNEKNIQMLLYLLKENGIKKVIVNPGTMNMSFVTSLQQDNFFELYSCVDERSACYMACGMAAESNEPVVLTCTGATASRNYMPGLTEAFYKKLPIIAITCTPHLGNIGNNIPQMIDRRNELNDTYKYSTYIPPIKQSDDLWYDNLEINKAILQLKSNNPGPVHINLGTEVTKIFDVDELPKFRVIRKYKLYDDFPNLNDYKKIGIFIGNHAIINNELQSEIETFCSNYNAVVICDYTSNYYGKYKIQFNILCDQESIDMPNNFDLLIHIGNTSGAYMQLDPVSVWRVNPDGLVVDTFKKLKNVFEMAEFDFFRKCNNENYRKKDNTLFDELNNELVSFSKLANELDLPFSNLYISKNLINKLPDDSVVHLAILNTLRSWNYFNSNKRFNVYCNTGGFGIDGILSTLIGASLCNTNKNYFGVIGDLAFFYDLNSLGNRHINSNLRIILVNNGCGTEFHNYSHPAHVIGQDSVSPYIAADGHFGNKSEVLVKNFVENLGFEYLSAKTKSEFIDNLDYFCSDIIYDKPVVFEVFTNSSDESEALSMIRNLKSTFKGKLKKQIKDNLSEESKSKIKKIIKR